MDTIIYARHSINACYVDGPIPGWRKSMGMSNTSSLRILDESELKFVFGGNGEPENQVVNGVRVGNFASLVNAGSSNYFISFDQAGFTQSSNLYEMAVQGEVTVSQEIPSPTNADGDIIIEVTPEQVQAAKLAYAQAGVELSFLQVALSIARVVSQKFGGAMEIAEATIDFKAFVNLQELQNSYADMLYYEDRLDGVYGNYPGTGPHTPEMPY